MTKIIDGKACADRIKMRLKEQVLALKKKGHVPCLAVIRVGDNPASAVYVGAKHRACQEVGVESRDYHLPERTTWEELKGLIDKLNNDKDVHGILLQLPLPSHLDSFQCINFIHPLKDVDGLTFENVGLLASGGPRLVPCTPKGCLTLLKANDISIAGKHAVVMGRSALVGRPMAQLFLLENATVSIVHSFTPDPQKLTKQADILVVAVGKPKLITSGWCREGVTIVDVGISRDQEGIWGDVDASSVMNIAQHITPVPGGVGPMTVASLLENTLECFSLLA